MLPLFPIGLILCACGPEDQPSPPPGVVLEVDGLEITAEELAQFDDYFESLDPTMGRNYRTREFLDQFVLPLRLAQRAFPEDRAEKRQRATVLAEAIGNGGYSALVERGEVYGGYKPDHPYSRNDLPLPVARFVFDENHLFQVSPPIEVAQGFALIATYRLMQGISTVQDRAEVYFVPFYTLDSSQFATWYEVQKDRIRNRVTYVHPDYRQALPSWFVLDG